MTYVYIKLQHPSQLQKFWINYLRGDNTFIINQFDDISEERKSNCKKITLGADVFPISKAFFNYILKCADTSQYYITNFSSPANSNETFLIHDPQLERIKKFCFQKCRFQSPFRLTG